MPELSAIQKLQSRETFSIVWHRLGNEPSAAQAAHTFSVNVDRPVHTLVECDLKWDLRSSGALFLHHGPTGMEPLTASFAQRLGCASLESLLHALAPTSTDLVIELKAGFGSRAEALRILEHTLEAAGFAHRAILAFSNPQALEDAARVVPSLPRALFVLHVRRDGRVFHFPVTDLPVSLATAGYSDLQALSSVNLLLAAGTQAPEQQLVRSVGMTTALVPGRCDRPEDLPRFLGGPGVFAYFDPRRPVASSSHRAYAPSILG